MATEVIKIVDPDNGSGTHYTSLAAWEAGEQRDLVSADEIAVAKCRCTGGSGDDNPNVLNLSGWVTDDTRYLKIWTDPSEPYRHNGTFPESGNIYRYRTDEYYGFISYVDHVRFEGIAFTCVALDNAPTFYGYSATAQDYRFKDCVFKNVNVQIWEEAGAADVYLINCIFYDFNYAVLYHIGTGTHWYIYNTSFVDCAYGIAPYSAGDIVCKNVICYSIGGYDFIKLDEGSSIVCYNCISKDESADDFGGSGNITGATLIFKDRDNDDYHLSANDTVAIGAGTDLSSDGNYAFNDDIDGELRGAVWDIGADEFSIPSGGFERCSNRGFPITYLF